MMHSGFSIRWKLALLAGFPVVGALSLALLLALHAEESARAAAALGSVEDLAELTQRISDVVHEVQAERAVTAVGLAVSAERHRLSAQRAQTDAARARLERFLGQRDLKQMPAELAKHLGEARSTLSSLPELRAELDAAEVPETKPDSELEALLPDVDGADSATPQDAEELERSVRFYTRVNDSLIAATAGLIDLSDDGELLRSINALVRVMQLKERDSQQHAWLAYVFGVGSFPPGSYRSIVTLNTEAELFEALLDAGSAEDQGVYRQHMSAEGVTRANELLKTALAAVEDNFQVDASEWFSVQGQKISRLRDVESRLTVKVKSAARAKISTTKQAVLVSGILSVIVVLGSIVLAVFIVRGINRSLLELTQTATRVREQKDFSARARITSRDELGLLTAAFNEMLAGLQARDQQLSEHREQLEEKVLQRTGALQERNVAMRLVLDNVAQGLATVQLDGMLQSERSRRFDEWFETSEGPVDFAKHIAERDPEFGEAFALGWEQVSAGLLPNELSLAQMPRAFAHNGRHYALAFRSIEQKGELMGALMVVTDKTADIAQARRETEQHERLAVFQRLAEDRGGFVEFFEEAQRLVQLICDTAIDRPSLLRAVHTLKGNCGMFGVASVASACHDFEQAGADGELGAKQFESLESAWNRFAERTSQLVGSGHSAGLWMSEEELQKLERAVAKGRPHSEIARALSRFRLEPAALRFRRMADLAADLARRLGKLEPEVVIMADDVKLPPERYSALWSALVHVVRNAIAHGIEPAEERTAEGKPAAGRIELAARLDDRRCILEIRDDGRGIAFDRVREAAIRKGIPHQTADDLTDALFADGLSTVVDVNLVSGRGVGMGAVRQAVLDLGGQIQVSSSLGTGTTVQISIPTDLDVQAPEQVPRSL